VDQYFTTMSTGEELLISEGSCCGAAVVCSFQAEQILGGGARVSALLTLKGEGGGGEEVMLGERWFPKVTLGQF